MGKRGGWEVGEQIPSSQCERIELLLEPDRRAECTTPHLTETNNICYIAEINITLIYTMRDKLSNSSNIL